MMRSEKGKSPAREKKAVILLIMIVCGAALVLASYFIGDGSQELQRKNYAESSVEQRLSQLMSMIDGAGQVDVLVTEGDSGVVGVLIVADGAQELTIRTELMRAAMTALDIPAESVEVFVRIKEETD